MSKRIDEVERFFTTMKKNCDTKHIKEAAKVPAVRLELSGHRGSELGVAQRIKRHLEAVYVPSEFEVKFIRDRMESAYEFGRTAYQNEQCFIEMLYDLDTAESRWPDCTENQFPTLLTGRAGVGKSSLLRAIARVMNDGMTLRVLDAHSEFPTLPAAKAAGAAQEFSVTEVLKQLAVLNLDEQKYKQRRLRALVKSRLIQRLTCFYSYDEVQFVSSRSLISVWNILTDLQSLRFPWVFAANYDLVTRLLKGPEQNVQRVMNKVVVLTPPLAGSDAWIDLLKEYDKVFGDTLDKKLVSLESELWDYSCGIRRILINILFHAFQISRQRSASKVSEEDIAIASQAHGVTCQVSSVRKQLGNSFPQKDEACPFASPEEKQYKKDAQSAADRSAGRKYAASQAPVQEPSPNTPTGMDPQKLRISAKLKPRDVPSQKDRDKMSNDDYRSRFIHPGNKPNPPQ